MNMSSFKSLNHPRSVAFLLSVSAFWAGTISAELPGEGGGVPVKVIDMHTHVFNARDLPLVGVLSALGAPRPVAVVVAEGLLLSTPEDTWEPTFTASMAQLERPVIAPLSEPQRNVLVDYVGRDRVEPLRMTASALDLSPDVTLLAETIAKIGFPPEEHLVRPIVLQGLTAAKDLGDALKGYLRFIGIMTHSHSDVVAALQKSYPQADLFVHHMMDMAGAYDDTPATPFPEQMAVMQKLDATFPGKLLHFTAFDPFRREAALPLAQGAVTKYGATGLKVYPPSGYRAAENAKYGFPPKPPLLDIWGRKRWNSRYGEWTPADLDKTLQGGFAWAAKTGVPIFTHCTPGGFEAVRAHGNVPGYGMMADPFFWAVALNAAGPDGFRICFGHSGGEAYWFSDPGQDSVNQKNKPPGDAWQFGNQVIELCRNYPDVYCDVGYLDGILDPKQAAVLARRLEAVVNLPGKDGKWRVGDKLVYGTDWHMIYKQPGYEKYLQAWDDVMKQVDKGQWRQRFFAGNAKKFLRLDELAKDSRFTTAQRTELSALSAAIK
jgi:predicted TIM-barrel fold metal-dependent hydrolase